MQDAPDGRLLVAPPTFGRSSENRKRRHQVELLTDAGLACWESKSMVRATNHGYEFLETLCGQGAKYRTMFMDLMNKGKTIADAVNAVHERSGAPAVGPSESHIVRDPNKTIALFKKTELHRAQSRGRTDGHERRVERDETQSTAPTAAECRQPGARNTMIFASEELP